MNQLESVLFRVAIGLFLVSALWMLGAFVFNCENLKRRFALPVLAAFAALTAVIIVRWYATGHGPVMKDYENALLGAWLTTLLYLIFAVKWKEIAAIGVVTAPAAMLLLGYAFMAEPVLEPLSPGYKSFWLYVHVFTAWLAFGAYIVAFGFATAFFLRSRHDRNNTATKLPEPAVIDKACFRIVLSGFILHAVMIVAGSFWASRLWGSYWGWDPIETWSLISWLLYGIIIHLRFTFGWRDKKFAVMTMLALTGVILAWFGVNWIPSSDHVFSKLE